MSKHLFKAIGVALIGALAVFSSCEKDSATVDVENYVSQSVYSMEEAVGCGMAGCFELVFPVTIGFPDSTTLEVNNYDELRQAIQDWIIANGGGRPGRPGRPGAGMTGRPVILFPFDVITESGDVVTITNEEELRALRATCINASFPPNHLGHHGDPCFELVFPVTILFPDGSTVSVNSREELQDAIREWKLNNPGPTGRPQLEFPLTVQLQDGTQVTVNSREELRALKEDCKG